MDVEISNRRSISIKVWVGLIGVLLLYFLVFPISLNAQDDEGKSKANVFELQENENDRDSDPGSIADLDASKASAPADSAPADSAPADLRNRLVGFGLIGGGILALLGLLFAYLRLDHATRGFYGGRLQLVAAIAAIAILATCYFLWSQVLFK